MNSYFIKDKGFYGQLWRLCVPLTLQQLLMVGVNALNSLMMGRFGEVDMTAVSQASQLFYIFTVLSYGFISPVTVLAAQYWGKKDENSARTFFGISARFGLGVGAAAFLAVLLFPAAVMRIMTSDPEVLAIGTEYMRLVSFAMIPYCISNLVYCFSRGIGRVKLIFWGNIVSYASNLLVSYLCIFGRLGIPQLGAMGAAVGTLVSRVFECVFLLVCLFKTKDGFSIRPADFVRYDRVLSGDYIKVLKPILGHEFIWSFGTSASQIVLGQLSTAAAAAYNIVYVLNQLLCAVLTGISWAAQAMVGSIIGSGDLEKARRATRSILAIATAFGLAGMLSMFAFGSSFISLYRISAETAAYAKQFLPIMAVVTFFASWEYVGLVGILRSGGDAKTGFYTDIVTMWMIAIPLGVLAAFKWQLAPVLVILLIKLDMPLKATVGLVRALGTKWINNLTR